MNNNIYNYSNNLNNYEYNQFEQNSDYYNYNSDKKTFGLKKILLIILCIIIFIIVCIIIKNLMKSYNMHFYLNGASTIVNENVKCKSNYLGHCYLQLPDVERNDGEVIGFSDIPSSHDAIYHIGDEIEMFNDMSLYVISKKKYSLEIDMQEIDEISSSPEDLSCYTYNDDNKPCNIVVPMFNKKGYRNEGYSVEKGVKEVTVYPGEEYPGGKKLYPLYSPLLNKQIIEAKNSFAINHAYIDVEKTCPEDKVEKFTNYIKKAEQNFPFLFHNQKIIFHGNDNFYRFFNNDSGTHGVTFGENSSTKTLSIRCGDDIDFIPVLIHELAHSLDYHYKDKLGIMISDEKDIIDLFDKYILEAKEAQNKIVYSINDKPLRFYAYFKNRKEFFAELLCFYYINYIDKEYNLLDVKYGVIKTTKDGINYKTYIEGYFRGNYPDDMKKVAEKYICIAKNNFDKTKCS